MNKTLEGLARAEWKRHYTAAYEDKCENKEEWEMGMKAALLWLASNVSDEMCKAAARQYFDNISDDEEIPARMLVAFGGAISAALRAAAEG